MNNQLLFLCIFCFVVITLMGWGIVQMCGKERMRKERNLAMEKAQMEAAKTARMEAENDAKDKSIADHRVTIANLVSRLRGGS